MRHSYVVPMMSVMVYEHEVAKGILILDSTKTAGAVVPLRIFYKKTSYRQDLNVNSEEL